MFSILFVLIGLISIIFFCMGVYKKSKVLTYVGLTMFLLILFIFLYFVFGVKEKIN